MKNYKSYLDRQEISQAAHENLLNLEVGKRSARPWVKYGALAACAALISLPKSLNCSWSVWAALLFSLI